MTREGREGFGAVYGVVIVELTVGEKDGMQRGSEIMDESDNGGGNEIISLHTGDQGNRKPL
jgi:hypothetical protein